MKIIGFIGCCYFGDRRVSEYINMRIKMMEQRIAQVVETDLGAFLWGEGGD